MKFTIEKSLLLPAALKACSLVPASSGVVALRNVWLCAENEALSLMSTDSQVEFTGSVSAVIDSDGLVGVPGKNFGELVKRLPDGPIKFELDKENKFLVVKSGRSSYKLAVVHKNWFQPLSPFPDGKTAGFEGEELSRLIERVSFAIGGDNSENEVFSNLCIRPLPDGRVQFCGLNGHTCAIATLPEGNSLHSRLSGSDILIQKKFLPHIRRMVKGEAEIAITDKRIFFRADGVLSVPLSSESYPDCDIFLDKFKEEGVSRMIVNRDAMLRALDRVSFLGGGITLGAVFAFSPEELVITASGDTGAIEEVVPVEFTGGLESVPFAVNSFNDCCSHVEGENLEMQFCGRELPCSIVGVDTSDYIVVTMPFRMAETVYYTEDDDA